MAEAKRAGKAASNGTPARKPRTGPTPVDFALCMRCVPEGVLAQVQALLQSEAKGAKTCRRKLGAITYHLLQHDKWQRKVEYHSTLCQEHAATLAQLLGQRQRTPSSYVAIRKFLSDMPEPVLRSLAEAKGVPWSEDVQAVILTLSQMPLASMTATPSTA